jgi:hypothetical protein
MIALLEDTGFFSNLLVSVFVILGRRRVTVYFAEPTRNWVPLMLCERGMITLLEDTGSGFAILSFSSFQSPLPVEPIIEYRTCHSVYLCRRGCR